MEGEGRISARRFHVRRNAAVLDELLNPAAAAHRLGITRTTLYDWLGRSRRGLLEIHGRRVTIEFFQTGPRSQGRIRIEAREIARLKELLRVVPTNVQERRPIVPRNVFPHITVLLGRPGRGSGA